MTMPNPATPVAAACDEGHRPLSAAEAVILIRALYAVGVGYHHLADLTQLDLTHVQMRQLLQVPDLAEQANILARWAVM